MKQLHIVILSLFGAIGLCQAGPLFVMDGFDARGFGLAQATIAEPGESGGFQVNPAVLAADRSVQFSAFVLPWFEGMTFFSTTCSLPLKIGRLGIVGAGFSYSGFGVEAFPNFDENGLPQGNAGASDHLLTVSAGMMALKWLSCGVSLKFSGTSLAGVPGFTGCLDAGAIAKFRVPALTRSGNKPNLQIGTVFQNLGFPQKFKTAASPLPFKFQLGFDYTVMRYLQSELSLLGEMNASYGQRIKTAVGLEINSSDFLRLRLGYRLSGGTLIGLTAGAGLAFQIKGFEASFDYAFVPLSDLGGQNVFSISFALPEVKAGGKR